MTLNGVCDRGGEWAFALAAILACEKFGVGGSLAGSR